MLYAENSISDSKQNLITVWIILIYLCFMIEDNKTERRSKVRLKQQQMGYCI